MDNNKNNPQGKLKIAPTANNDQLGENADMEFAQSYDNKSNLTPARPANKSKDKK